MDGMDLKIARIRAHLTLWDLGKLAGLHAARISEMETGKRPIDSGVVDALDRESANMGLGRPE